MKRCLFKRFIRVKDREKALPLENQRDLSSNSELGSYVTIVHSPINPHFLYNTLECIRGEALLSGNKNIEEMTSLLSSFFRYSISFMGDLVTLNDELQNISQYVAIQKFRFYDRFSLEISKEIDTDPRQLIVPKMILQPIVENSIIHGFSNIISGGIIRVFITQSDQNLTIEISDNGIGIPDEVLNVINSEVQNDKATHQGIAIQDIRNRIKSQFGKEYGIRLYSTVDVGTQAIITLPVQIKPF